MELEPPTSFRCSSRVWVVERSIMETVSCPDFPEPEHQMKPQRNTDSVPGEWYIDTACIN
jgi:hypothetical protein